MTMADERLPVASARQVWRAAKAALGARRWHLLVLCGILLAAATLNMLPAFAFGAMVDAAADHDGARIWWYGAAAVVALCAASVLTGLGIAFGGGLFEPALARLRESLVDSALRLPQTRVERAGTGDVVSRASDDVSRVAQALPGVVPAITGSVFTIALSVGGMALIHPAYALVMLAISPVHVWAARRFMREAPEVYAHERAAMAERAQHLLESVHGLRTVHAFRLGESRRAIIARASWDVVRWSVRAVVVQNRFFGRLNLAEFVGMGGLLLVGFVLVQDGSGSVGATTTAMLLFLRLFDPINALLFVTDDLLSASASLARIVGVIQADAEAGDHVVPPRDAPSQASHPLPVVAVHGVTFSYDAEHTVLRNVDLELFAGERVAIVGMSGAGKSTLAALVGGVLDPTGGWIAHPRGRTVLVAQETHVFDGTLRSNLTLARPDADATLLHDTLSRIGAQRLLRRSSDGLDATVGGSTIPLPGRDAQLLALARADLADPALLILDEATAEEGSALAGELDAAAARVMRGRTSLVITHRLEQAAAADRIVVLDDGRIIEQGDHGDLLDRGGVYARLWDARRSAE